MPSSKPPSQSQVPSRQQTPSSPFRRYISFIGSFILLICFVSNILPSFTFTHDSHNGHNAWEFQPSVPKNVTVTDTRRQVQETQRRPMVPLAQEDTEKTAKLSKRVNGLVQMAIKNDTTRSVPIITSAQNNNNSLQIGTSETVGTISTVEPIIKFHYHRLQHLDWKEHRRSSYTMANGSNNVSSYYNNLNHTNYFSACILIKDENHRLPEWLGYHWYMMSLRHIVVLMDPHATTSPDAILQRWEPLMEKIDIWHNNDIKFQPIRYNNPFQEFIRRQKSFYSKCSMYLKEQGRTWTSYFDVDEYLVLEEILGMPKSRSKSKISTNSSSSSSSNSSSSNPSSSNPSSSTTFFPGAILQRIYDPMPYARHLIKNDTSTCIPVDRVQFGAKEDDDGDNETRNDNSNTFINTKGVLAISSSSSVNTTMSGIISKLETLRFHWRAKKSVRDKLLRQKVNGPPKSLFNVQYAPKSRYAYGIHWVIKPDCQFSKWKKPMLYLHHYKGSKEMYFAREDKRRNEARFEESQKHTNTEHDGKLLTWIYPFIAYVGGEIMAQYLLQGVGQITKR